VGEATVEVSAYFLTRVLGLTRHLNESHLVKQGFRFWFANDQVHGLDNSSEAGGRYLARVPTFHVVTRGFVTKCSTTGSTASRRWLRAERASRVGRKGRASSRRGYEAD